MWQQSMISIFFEQLALYLLRLGCIFQRWAVKLAIVRSLLLASHLLSPRHQPLLKMSLIRFPFDRLPLRALNAKHTTRKP